MGETATTVYSYRTHQLNAFRAFAACTRTRFARTSRLFRELSDHNKAGPLETGFRLCKSTCPQKHTLASTTAAEGLCCDVCRRGIAAGEEIYSCEPCDFDACYCCGAISHDGAIAHSTRGTVAPPVTLLPAALRTDVPEGNQALGRRLSMLWREERPPTWFSGVVRQHNAFNNEHLVRSCRQHRQPRRQLRGPPSPQIVYEDEDQRWHDLEAEARLGNVKWLGRAADPAPDAAPPPAKRPRSTQPAAAGAGYDAGWVRKHRREEASAPVPPAIAPRATPRVATRATEPKATKPKVVKPKAAKPQAAKPMAAKPQAAKPAAAPLVPSQPNDELPRGSLQGSTELISKKKRNKENNSTKKKDEKKIIQRAKKEKEK